MTATMLRTGSVSTTDCTSGLQNLNHTPLPVSPTPDLVVSFDGKEFASSKETKIRSLI